MYMEVRKLTFNSEGGISNYAKPIYPKNWAVLVLAHMLAASKSSCTIKEFEQQQLVFLFLQSQQLGTRYALQNLLELSGGDKYGSIYWELSYPE